jgi:hypothetical protein
VDQHEPPLPSKVSKQQVGVAGRLRDRTNEEHPE